MIGADALAATFLAIFMIPMFYLLVESLAAALGKAASRPTARLDLCPLMGVPRKPPTRCRPARPSRGGRVHARAHRALLF